MQANNNRLSLPMGKGVKVLAGHYLWNHTCWSAPAGPTYSPDTRLGGHRRSTFTWLVSLSVKTNGSVLMFLCV